jgi:hypothetical protein
MMGCWMSHAYLHGWYQLVRKIVDCNYSYIIQPLNVNFMVSEALFISHELRPFTVGTSLQGLRFEVEMHQLRPRPEMAHRSSNQ